MVQPPVPGRQLNAFTIASISKAQVQGGYEETPGFGDFYRKVRDDSINGVCLVQRLWGKYKKAEEYVDATTPDISLQLEVSQPFKFKDGIFTLQTIAPNSDTRWVENAMSVPSRPDLDIVDVFEAGHRFGTQTEHVIASKSKLRHALSITGCPITFKDPIVPGFTQLLDRTKIQTQSIIVSTLFSPTSVRTSIGNVTEMYYNHRGFPRIWFMIPPAHEARFVSRIRHEFRPEIPQGESCSQVIRHLSIWLDPDQVRTWGIDVVEVKQAAGQLLFIQAHTYYWGFSQGYSVLEQRYLPGPGFTCEGYVFCIQKHALCRSAKDYSTLFEPTRMINAMPDSPEPSPSGSTRAGLVSSDVSKDTEQDDEKTSGVLNQLAQLSTPAKNGDIHGSVEFPGPREGPNTPRPLPSPIKERCVGGGVDGGASQRQRSSSPTKKRKLSNASTMPTVGEEHDEKISVSIEEYNVVINENHVLKEKVSKMEEKMLNMETELRDLRGRFADLGNGF